MRSKSAPRLLAVASGGGHWEQLMLMRDAFDGFEVHFATTISGLPERASVNRWSIVPDCNRHQPLQVLRCTARMLLIALQLRPSVVVTTGALPGVLALVVAKVFRAKTVWIDSVANAEEISMSGAFARRFADAWISQWRHVADHSGAIYLGSVL